MSNWESLLPFVLIVVVFWFLVVRPARKQQQRLAATQASAQIGTDVMLGSGIYGTVTGVGDETFDIQIAPGTTIKVAKQAVVRVVEHEQEPEGGTPPSQSDDTSAGPQDQ